MRESTTQLTSAQVYRSAITFCQPYLNHRGKGKATAAILVKEAEGGIDPGGSGLCVVRSFATASVMGPVAGFGVRFTAVVAVRDDRPAQSRWPRLVYA